MIPTVNPFLGSSASRLSNTDFTIAGVKSFELSPYLPPTISGYLSNDAIPSAIASPTAVRTSIYKGSPNDPGSFVLSSVAILVTVFGKTSIRCFVLKGLNNLTLTTPTFSPLAVK